jgi:hypothetical protein
MMFIVYALLAIFGGVAVIDAIRVGPQSTKQLPAQAQRIPMKNAPVIQNVPITEAAYHVADFGYQPAIGYAHSDGTELEVWIP